MDPLSDEELISLWRDHAGSPEAEHRVNELFRRYHARVALWCLRLTGDREYAADLAQEVFLKAFRSLASFRGDAKFSTWLYSIARNHCYNRMKARAVEPQQEGDFLADALADPAHGPLAQLERESSSKAFRELLQDSLTDLEMQAVTLHYVDELPLAAVTRLLKLENASGAKSYIVSARRKLAHAVERWKARGQRVPQ